MVVFICFSHLTVFKHFLLDSKFQFIGSNLKRVLRHARQTQGPILSHGKPREVDVIEGIGCKAGEMGLEVESQTA